MKQRARKLAVGLSVLALWACANKAAPTAARKPATAASPSAGIRGAASPAAPSAAPVAATNASGVVLGLDGKPAVGVTVQAYLIANNGGGLVANNGGGVISSHGGALRLLDVATQQTTTAADGSFTLSGPAGQQLNVEAVQNATTKAIRQGVEANATGLQLQLQLTGSLEGQVSAPGSPNVSNFEGVHVFIPGTSYSAFTDRDGRYRLDNVPVGQFTVVATKDGLGRAERAGVAVAPKAATALPLALALAVPKIASVTPEIGSVGSQITIVGESFGASTGSQLTVTIAGVTADHAEAKDDHTIVAEIPSGVTASGAITVKVDGAQASHPFTFLTSLVLPNTYRDLAVGTPHRFHVAGLDADGAVHLDPPGEWTVTDSIATVDATGTVKAQHAGKVQLAFKVGARTAKADLTLHTDAFATFAAGDGLGVAGSADGLFARFNQPGAVAVGKDGALYVADTGNNSIRRVGPDGLVTTLAGSAGAAVNAQPTPFPFSDETSSAPSPNPQPSGLLDGPGSAARFDAPGALAVDDAGNVYVVDANNGCLRKIDAHGVVTTLGKNAQTATFKATGNLADADFGLKDPAGVAWAGGTLLIADAKGGSGGDGAIYRVEASGAFHAIATGEGALARHLLAGGVTAPVATPTPLDPSHISRPNVLALGPDGTIYAEQSQGAVVAFAPPAYAPHLVPEARGASGLAVDADNALWWLGNALSRLARGGGRLDLPLPNGEFLPIPMGGSLVWNEDLDTAPPHANVGAPTGLAIGPHGELFVADPTLHTVMQLFPASAP